MIKIDMKKILNNTMFAASDMIHRGGVTYFRYIFFINIVRTVSTTSLWLNIAMNKQYITNLFCQNGLLISPFNNLLLQWGFANCEDAICLMDSCKKKGKKL